MIHAGPLRQLPQLALLLPSLLLSPPSRYPSDHGSIRQLPLVLPRGHVAFRHEGVTVAPRSLALLLLWLLLLLLLLLLLPLLLSMFHITR